MNKVVNFPNEKAAYHQAGVWIARLDRGLSADEQTELQQWLRADSRNRDALFELAELWDRMTPLAELSELFPAEHKVTGRNRHLSRPLVVACAVACIGVSLGYWVMQGQGSTSRLALNLNRLLTQRNDEARYETGIGVQKSVTLHDRSVITLNTDTVLKVHYTDTERHLELIKGEAHFAVAKHDPRVFIVQVGDDTFKAVGTAFNLRVASERGVELTVTEGRVKVLIPTAKETVSNSDAVDGTPETEITVDAGRAVAISNGTQVVERAEPQKIDAAVAWMHGMIVFDGQPLEAAIREVGRYSKQRFVIEGEQIKRIPVTGYFKVDDINGLLGALQTNFNVDAHRNGDLIVLAARQQ
jgi:transmembrane sensor